jgi:hypothetical protein
LTELFASGDKMKATINGLRYDTEKAVLVGKAASAARKPDFEWWQAGLYKSPRAERYFLAGQGGPMTRWASGPSGIVPIDTDSARDWAERYLGKDEVEAAFGRNER